jgi:hypothetical protein
MEKVQKIRESHKNAHNLSSGPFPGRTEATGRRLTNPTKFIVKMHLYIMYIGTIISCRNLYMITHKTVVL